MLASMLSGCGGASVSAIGVGGASASQPSGGSAGRRIGGSYGDTDAFDTGTVTRKYLDVPYANVSPAQKLDIYLPESGRAPYPVILAIHGGGFRQGDKADGQVEPMFAGLARGYAVVSINYRLTPEAIWPAQINDAKAAVRFLRANAATYSLDAEKIVAWGDSAGGTLAALLGTTGGVAALADGSLGNAETSDRVRAAVDWFGPIDFATMDAQSQLNGFGSRNRNAATSFESMFFGASMPTVPDRVKSANAATYITTDDPPMLLEHGTDDKTIPYQQSVVLANELTEALGQERVTLRILAGADHLDSAFVTADNMAYVLDWIDERAK